MLVAVHVPPKCDEELVEKILSYLCFLVFWGEICRFILGKACGKALDLLERIFEILGYHFRVRVKRGQLYNGRMRKCFYARNWRSGRVEAEETTASDRCGGERSLADR